MISLAFIAKQELTVLFTQQNTDVLEQSIHHRIMGPEKAGPIYSSGSSVGDLQRWVVDVLGIFGRLILYFVGLSHALQGI